MSQPNEKELEAESSQVARSDSQGAEQATLRGDQAFGEKDAIKKVVDEPKGDEDVLIVDWDGPDDPANPKKCVTLQPNLICRKLIVVVNVFLVGL